MVAILLGKELCSECRPTEEEILRLELEQRRLSPDFHFATNHFLEHFPSDLTYCSDCYAFV